MAEKSDHEESEPRTPGGLRARLSFLTGAWDSRPRSLAAVGVWIVVALALLIVAVGAAAGSAPLSRHLCSTCHEMEPKVAAWRVSPHAQIECYSCHGAPHPWYSFPQTLADKGKMLSRYVSVHWSGKHEEAIGENTAHLAPISDSTCLQCHDPARTATSRFGVLIQHAKHAARNKSCISCHLWTAHQDPNADRDLLFMGQCFKCHGQTADAKAPGACDLCHPKGSDLHPASHKTGDWQMHHGETAKKDRQQCRMCHRDDFCRNCHGLDMPHPAGWAASGHPIVARQNREICTKCHKGSTYLCTMCHHKGFDDQKGSWVNQHYLMVQETGPAFCMQCHDGPFCIDCHAKTANQDIRPGSSAVLTKP